ncbi:unnamed protein product [Arctogadus glacialis]
MDFLLLCLANASYMLMLATGSARNTVSTERSSILFRPLPTTVGLACTSCTKERRAPVGVGVSVHAAGKGIGLKAGNAFFLGDLPRAVSTDNERSNLFLFEF